MNNIRKPVDMAGQTVGRWKVIGWSHKAGRGRNYWACECVCGTKRAVLGHSLRRGQSQSCGCLVKEVVTIGSTTHDLSRHPAYRSYRAMRSRCENPKSSSYALYGGRGITICERWSRFEMFWLDMGPTWRPGRSIERVDFNGNYDPANCRWATSMEQGSNRRDNVTLDTPDGPMTLSNAARFHGIPYHTISSRMRYGWKGADLFLPVTKDNSRRQKQVIIPTPDGPMMVSEAAKRYGIDPTRIYHRVRLGWKPEDLLKPVEPRKRTAKGKFDHAN